MFDVNVMLSVPATAFTGVTTKMTFDGVVNAATLCIVTEVQPILVRTAYPVWAVISISSVVDEAENSTGPAVFAFVLSPPRQVKISSWPAAEPAPITIASVSASVVVCEVVELVTATDVAPAHVHVTLVASAKLQRAFDAVSVIVLVARTDRVGVTLIIMPLGVPDALTGVPDAVPANAPTAFVVMFVVMVQSFVGLVPPSEVPRILRVSPLA